MANISQIEVSATTYDIEDTTARQLATSSSVGRVQPDNVTITINEDGVISSTGGGGGGSNIYVSTSDSSLFGQIVTITDGTITATATFSSGGTASFLHYMGTGWATISASNGTSIAYAYVNCSYYGTYRVTLAFFTATVNISTSEVELMGGGPVYISSDSAPNTTLTFDALGHAVYTAHVPGTYTFTII